jgi:hypothetical protein
MYDVYSPRHPGFPPTITKPLAEIPDGALESHG